jgi:hypothetical protein
MDGDFSQNVLEQLLAGLFALLGDPRQPLRAHTNVSLGKQTATQATLQARSNSQSTDSSSPFNASP